MNVRNSIIWRMLAWFLLLALIPLGAVIFFIQRQVNETILDVELQAVAREARLLAAESASHPGTFEEHTDVYRSDAEQAFLLSQDGFYLQHTLPHQVGVGAGSDFNADILELITTGDSGSHDNSDQNQIIGYATIPGQNTVAVIVKDKQAITNTLSTLSRSILVQLSVILLITSTVSGIAILAVINPLRQLATYADRIGSGDLDARIDTVNFEGEIAILAESLTTMTARLRGLISSLEDKVDERTRDLAIAGDVSRQITRVLDLEQLLPELVERTRQGFSLYYVSLYLFDQQTQKLRLEAAAGEKGAPIEENAISFHLDEQPSVIAQAARNQRAEIINDTAVSPVYSFNPQLPQTRAEAAFPMLVSDKLVGVLDLQSEVKEHFQEGERQIYSTLAEQIAIAVRNAQLYREQAYLAQELERADLVKSQFLASMSHELRTPLNAIINFNQLIAMGAVGPVTDEQVTMLNTALSSARHLLQLINDVLDISKIQAGKLSLFIEESVIISEEIDAVVDMAEPLLQKHNSDLKEPVQLILDIDTELPLIACDRRRLRQVLLNLLSNAIKFTEKGSITLGAKNSGHEVLFAVMDTGRGIPEEMQEQIFEPFVQSADGLQDTQGSGLGLHISRSLVETHGGELWVDSHIDEGTTIFFSLPIQPRLTK